MAGKRIVSATVFVVDRHPTMRKETGVTVQELGVDKKVSGSMLAQEYLRNHLSQMLLFKKNAHSAVVLFNTAETSNDLHDQCGGYEHVNATKAMGAPSLRDLNSVDDYLGCEDDEDEFEDVEFEGDGADLFDAVLVAMGQLQGLTPAVQKKIVLVTSASTPCGDLDQLSTIGGSLVDQKIELEVVLPYRYEDPTRNAPFSEVETKNYKIIDEFATKHTVCNLLLAEAAAAKSVPTNQKPTMQNALYNGPLEITKDLSVQVSIYTKVRELTASTLRTKTWERMCDNPEEYVEPMRVYQTFDDEPKVTYESNDEDIRTAYRYGVDGLVPVDEQDKIHIMESEEKNMRLVCFVKERRIPRYWYKGGVDIVVPKKKSETDAIALSAFIGALADQKKLAICRIVSRKGASPRCVALAPYLEEEAADVPCLQMFTLPFSNEFRSHWTFSSVLAENNARRQMGLVPSEALVEDMEELVDAMDLSHTVAAQKNKDFLLPESTSNPLLRRLYHNVQERALTLDGLKDEDADEDPLEWRNFEKLGLKLNTTTPDASSVWLQRQPKFVVPVEEKLNEIFARLEMHADLRIFRDDQEQDVIPTFVLQQWNQAEPVEEKKAGLPEKLSTADPAADLIKMVNSRNPTLMTTAFQQAKEMVEELVERRPRQAKQLLHEFRSQCASQGEQKRYNTTLLEWRQRWYLQQRALNKRLRDTNTWDFWHDLKKQHLHFVPFVCSDAELSEHANDSVEKRQSEGLLTAQEVECFFEPPQAQTVQSTAAPSEVAEPVEEEPESEEEDEDDW